MNDIRIYPASASIHFSGSAADRIILQTLPSGSVAFMGSSGSLFSIDDELSGSLMSVNDASGLPIFEVFSDATIKAGAFNQNDLVISQSIVGIGTQSSNGVKLTINDTLTNKNEQVVISQNANTNIHLGMIFSKTGSNYLNDNDAYGLFGGNNTYLWGSSAWRRNTTGFVMGSNVSAFGIRWSTSNLNQASGDDRFHLTSGGAVGIGTNLTTMGTSSVEIFNNATASSESSYGLSIISAWTDTKLVLGASRAGYSSISSLQHATSWDGRPLVFQPNGGRVGIGVTNPDARLAFAGTTGEKISLYTTNNNFRFGLSVASAIGTSFWTRLYGPGYVDGGVQIGGVSTSDGTTFNPAISVLGFSGLVGIGTTQPSASLHISPKFGQPLMMIEMGSVVQNGSVQLKYDPAYNQRRNEGKINLLGSLSGRIINRNTEFLDGTTGWGVYDNVSSGRVTISSNVDTSSIGGAIPNSTGRVLKMTYNGTGTYSVSPTPGWGGVFVGATATLTGSVDGFTYKPGDRILYKLWARMSSGSFAGKSLAFASNATGDSFAALLWLSPSTNLSSSWTYYEGLQVIGNSGSFSSTGFFYVADSGPTNGYFELDFAKFEMVALDCSPTVQQTNNLNVGYVPGMALGFGQLVAASASYLAVDGVARMGIGTTVPLDKVHITGVTRTYGLSLWRAGVSNTGISWYTGSYQAWCTYMATAGASGQGPHGNITAPAAGTLVTSWALRNTIEDISGYGWTWEKCATGTSNPSLVAEMSKDGALRTVGNVTAPSFVGTASWASHSLQSTRLGGWDGTTYSWFNLNSNVIGSYGNRTGSLVPNVFDRSISWEFKNGSLASVGSNYGGLMTLAPYTGKTSDGGDSNYQLFFGVPTANSTTAPIIKTRAGIDTTWGAWHTLLHSYNYNTWVPNLTGSGASGTWGISVTGNSSAATYLNSAGDYVWNASTSASALLSSVLAISFVDNPTVGYPNYGTVIHARAYSGGGGGALQLYVPYGSGYGGTALQYRSSDYSANNANPPWTSWKTIIDSGNIGSQNVNYANSSGYAPYADNIYVNTTNTNASYYLVFSAGSAYQPLYMDVDSNFYYNPSTNTLTVSNLTVAGTLTATVTSAATASVVAVAANSTNANYGVAFVVTTGHAPLAYDGGGNFGYNPSTDTLSVVNISATAVTATTFNGSLNGNASTATSATTATTATNVTFGMTNNADDYMNFRVMRNNNTVSNRDGMYVGYGNANSGLSRVYGGGSTSAHLEVNATNARWYTGAVYQNMVKEDSGTYGISISGNAATATSATSATNANNVATTDDTTTSATRYIVFKTATSGNLPDVVSSTKLTFNPNAGSLTVAGNIQGGKVGCGGSPGVYDLYVNAAALFNGSISIASGETSTAEGSAGKTFYGWLRVTIVGVGLKWIRLFNDD